MRSFTLPVGRTGEEGVSEEKEKEKREGEESVVGSFVFLEGGLVLGRGRGRGFGFWVVVVVVVGVGVGVSVDVVVNIGGSSSSSRMIIGSARGGGLTLPPEEKDCFFLSFSVREWNSRSSPSEGGRKGGVSSSSSSSKVERELCCCCCCGRERWGRWEEAEFWEGGGFWIGFFRIVLFFRPEEGRIKSSSSLELISAAFPRKNFRLSLGLYSSESSPLGKKKLI